MSNNQTLQNQIALVTGASRGIGAAIAQELGKQGATVIGTATSAGGADNINASLQAAGIKGMGLALDVAVRDGRIKRGDMILIDVYKRQPAECTQK